MNQLIIKANAKYFAKLVTILMVLHIVNIYFLQANPII